MTSPAFYTHPLSNAPHDAREKSRTPFWTESDAPLPADFAEVVDHLSDLTRLSSHEPWTAASRAAGSQEGEHP